jgi:hypothetical protein
MVRKVGGKRRGVNDLHGGNNLHLYRSISIIDLLGKDRSTKIRTLFYFIK